MESMIQYSFSVKELGISIQELEELAHLGKEMPSYADFLKKELNILNEIVHITGGYTIRNGTITDDQLLLEGVTFKAGADVTRFYKGMDKAAIFLCSAGEEVSERSKQLSKSGDLIEGYLVDLLGSVLVEKAMDRLHEQLRAEMLEQGLNITNRYSPGYCSWDVREQSLLFNFFPHNFCGVTLTDSCLMLPVKTVSGIIGIGKEVKFLNHLCNQCNSVNCLYRGKKKRFQDSGL